MVLVLSRHWALFPGNFLLWALCLFDTLSGEIRLSSQWWFFLPVMNLVKEFLVQEERILSDSSPKRSIFYVLSIHCKLVVITKTVLLPTFLNIYEYFWRNKVTSPKTDGDKSMIAEFSFFFGWAISMTLTFV